MRTSADQVPRTDRSSAHSAAAQGLAASASTGLRTLRNKRAYQRASATAPTRRDAECAEQIAGMAFLQPTLNCPVIPCIKREMPPQSCRSLLVTAFSNTGSGFDRVDLGSTAHGTLPQRRYDRAQNSNEPSRSTTSQVAQ